MVAEATVQIHADCCYCLTTVNFCRVVNRKIALVIREDDYHWYRQNKDGTWSHKPGEFPVTNLDDADGLITDPRNAVSSYQFVKFYEVGPND